MSVDPNSGIAYLQMLQTSDGTIANSVQFSGVLIAHDEVLTVAHGVTAPDGTFRNVGSAYLDYDGGAQSKSVAITSIHVLDNSHPSDVPETDQQVSSDLAVVHLATPVSDAQVFSLGIAVPGSTYQMTGYPAVDNGTRTSVTEAFAQGAVPGELSGASLTGTASASGASGGPVFTTVDGNPTVVGLITAQDDQGGMVTSGLTAADIAQIDAWVYSDDASTAWGSDFSPSVAASAEQASASTPFSTPPVEPVSADRLDALSSELAAAAASGGPFSTLMSSVATALVDTRQQGGSDSDIPNAAYQAAADLANGVSSTPQRAEAFLGGLLAAESGIGLHHALGYMNTVFGLDVASSLSGLVRDGFHVEKNFGESTTSAAIDPHASVLASVLSNHAIAAVDVSSAGSASVSLTPSMMAGSHLSHHVG